MRSTWVTISLCAVMLSPLAARAADSAEDPRSPLQQAVERLTREQGKTVVRLGVTLSRAAARLPEGSRPELGEQPEQTAQLNKAAAHIADVLRQSAQQQGRVHLEHRNFMHREFYVQHVGTERDHAVLEVRTPDDVYARFEASLDGNEPPRRVSTTYARRDGERRAYITLDSKGSLTLRQDLAPGASRPRDIVRRFQAGRHLTTSISHEPGIYTRAGENRGVMSVRRALAERAQARAAKR